MGAGTFPVEGSEFPTPAPEGEQLLLIDVCSARVNVLSCDNVIRARVLTAQMAECSERLPLEL